MHSVHICDDIHSVACHALCPLLFVYISIIAVGEDEVFDDVGTEFDEEDEQDVSQFE